MFQAAKNQDKNQPLRTRSEFSLLGELDCLLAESVRIDKQRTYFKRKLNEKNERIQQIDRRVMEIRRELAGLLPDAVTGRPTNFYKAG